jgi:hypothetical protein
VKCIKVYAVGAAIALFWNCLVAKVESPEENLLGGCIFGAAIWPVEAIVVIAWTLAMEVRETN